jgi:tetratricopeptide (TPR) repeat protein
MQLSLEDAGERWFLLIVSCAVSTILIFQSAEIYVADRRVHSRRLPLMESGAELLPGNGEAWDRVGRFWQLDFASPDSSKAAIAYEKAVRDDPNSSYYWMDLASAYEDVGDMGRARRAFEQAETVYPISALVTWNYGNFLVRRQEYAEGYRKIQMAVLSDSKLIPLAISRTWRSSEDVNVLLDDVLPPTVEAYLAALKFFASYNQPDAALAVWKRLIGLGNTFPLEDTFGFLDELIGLDRAEDARRVWTEAIAAAGLAQAAPLRPALAAPSLLWNGNFSRDFANGGLDWRWNAPHGVSPSFDSPAPSASGRSLRLDFNGGVNLALESPAQYVPVQPSRAYHFHAFVRTEQITTDSGVRFWIGDPNHAAEKPVLTDNLTGTHAWMPVEADISTGPGTHFLVVRLERIASLMFDSKLGGTAWVSDLSFVPAATASASSP